MRGKDDKEEETARVIEVVNGAFTDMLLHMEEMSYRDRENNGASSSSATTRKDDLRTIHFSLEESVKMWG
jgi:hypothetical protein